MKLIKFKLFLDYSNLTKYILPSDTTIKKYAFFEVFEKISIKNVELRK